MYLLDVLALVIFTSCTYKLSVLVECYSFMNQLDEPGVCSSTSYIYYL